MRESSTFMLEHRSHGEGWRKFTRQRAAIIPPRVATCCLGTIVPVPRRSRRPENLKLLKHVILVGWCTYTTIDILYFLRSFSDKMILQTGYRGSYKALTPSSSTQGAISSSDCFSSHCLMPTGAEKVATRGHGVPLRLSTLDPSTAGAPCRYHHVDLLSRSLPNSQGRKAIPSGDLPSVGS